MFIFISARDGRAPSLFRIFRVLFPRSSKGIGGTLRAPLVGLGQNFNRRQFCDYAKRLEVGSILKIWSQNVGPSPPKKNGGQKRAKIGVILDNFRLRLQINLRNGSRYQKLENYLIDSRPSRVRQKMVDFSVLTTKLGMCILTYQNSDLPTHTPPRTNWPKIQRIRRNNFGASRSNMTKLVMCSEAGMRILVQILWTAKSIHNLARFQATSDFDREYIRNGSRHQQVENGVINYNLSHVGRKKIIELEENNY